MKTTAMQQLIDFMRDLRNEGWSGDIREIIVEADFLLIKEKQQIVDAHGNKRNHQIKQGIDVYYIKSGEQYYNETYGK